MAPSISYRPLVIYYWMIRNIFWASECIFIYLFLHFFSSSLLHVSLLISLCCVAFSISIYHMKRWNKVSFGKTDATLEYQINRKWLIHKCIIPQTNMLEINRIWSCICKLNDRKNVSWQSPNRFLPWWDLNLSIGIGISSLEFSVEKLVFDQSPSRVGIVLMCLSH